ncbi:amidohydrolase [Niabella beijingensis]|uniref:amidohydrolase n=1 Tax=Niabella beijingensis TaxID=2872700 RepID=UPI001CBF3FB4|nr:amidohydrolase [Niabella beijingensis]MBZ4190291.1 amidohydrolase [Niabella beijingensis]
MKKIVSLFLCIGLLTGVRISGQNRALVISRQSEALQNKLIQWRRHLHQYPELSNREVKTQQYVLAHLKRLGIETQLLAKTGVVGILKGGKPGPVIALRADMDALPVLERNGLPFRSTAKGEYLGKEVPVMHACGHDAHVAMLMGAAEVLSGMKSAIAGTVKFIFQPAEEGAPGDEEGGAELMVKEGVLDAPKVAAVFGMHIESWIEEGKVFYKPGPFMAASDWFTIKVKGSQSHGAQPWKGVDPIAVSAQIINALQQIVSRQQDLTKAPVVLTVGKINSGVRNNIIPEELEMAGTIRTFDTAMQRDVHRRIHKIATGIAAANGATAEVTIKNNTPVTFNNRELTQKIIPTLEKAVGRENVQETNWVTGAEDFAYYGLTTPAVFLYYGGMPKGNDPAKAPPHHTPDFMISDRMLYNGVKIFCNLVFDYPGIQ